MINMDMIGRMKDDRVIVGGSGTSPEWKIRCPDLTSQPGSEVPG